MKRKHTISWMTVVRLDRELTQRQLAARVGCSGVHISQVERGFKVPTAAMARRIAKALRCTVDDIFPPDDTPEPLALLKLHLISRKEARKRGRS